MFQFPAFASYPYVFEGKIPLNNSWKPEPHFHAVQTFQELEVGCPIRKSMDQSSFAAPHGLSQRITSFIACACQGIHQLPLRHLIVLIVYAHHQPSSRRNERRPGYLLQPDHFMTPSTCSMDMLYWSHAERLACSPSLRPASRDQIRCRAVRQRQSDPSSEAAQGRQQ